MEAPINIYTDIRMNKVNITIACLIQLIAYYFHIYFPLFDKLKNMFNQRRVKHHSLIEKS